MAYRVPSADRGRDGGGGMGMNDDWWLTIDDPVELGKVIAERALIAVMEAMQ